MEICLILIAQISPETQLFCNRYLIMCTVYTEYYATRQIIRALSDVEKPFLFSDLAALTAKSENKKGFSTSEKAQISCQKEHD